MTIFPFKIPQLGEGLVGARVVTLFKSAGQSIGRDEPLLEIETDKAVMSLESPVEGMVERWLVSVEDDAQIGAVVCQIRTPAKEPASPNGLSPNGAVKDAPALPEPPINPSGEAPLPNSAANGSENGHGTGALAPTLVRNGQVSPRLRAKARAEGVSARELEMWSREEGGRLSDEALSARIRRQSEEVAPGEPFVERSLSPRQARLAAHLERAWHGVVPAILEIEVSWDIIEREVESRRTDKARPTPLHIIAWAVVGAMREHPRFCSTWKGGGLLREWKHVNIGFAVALEDDELAVAVVPRAETLDFQGFSVTTRASIASVRGGEKAHGEAQFVISDLSRAGIISAIPLVMPPATATLFVGTPFDAPQKTDDGGLRWEKRARLVLSCDHRLVNGAGAAKFLGALQTLLLNGS